MKIKRTELRYWIKFNEDSIRNIKKVLKSPHNSDTCHYQWNLISERKNITLRYALMAHSRGRVHKSGHTLEDQEEYLEAYMDDIKRYLEVEPEPEVAAPTPPPKIKTKPKGFFTRVKELVMAA